jgi:hypothetical protein
MISFATAQLIGLFFEAVFYGIYLVTFILLLPRTIRRPLIALVISALFILSTVNLALGLVRALEGTIVRGDIPRDWVTLVKVVGRGGCQ